MKKNIETAIQMKKNIETAIEIDAAADVVWRILTDLERYSEWNPFIRRISGNVRVGERLEAVISPPGGTKMTFKPVVTVVEPEREFRWLGNLFFSWIFSGEHYFKIEPIDKARIRFVQGENFNGILVGLFAKSLDTNTVAGFHEMNDSLKARAEGKTDAL